jgi:hypothetical protein
VDFGHGQYLSSKTWKRLRNVIFEKKAFLAHYWTFLFHATPPRSQRTDYQRQSVSIVANLAALRGKCPVVCFPRYKPSLPILDGVSYHCMVNSTSRASVLTYVDEAPVSTPFVVYKSRTLRSAAWQFFQAMELTIFKKNVQWSLKSDTFQLQGE